VVSAHAARVAEPWRGFGLGLVLAVILVFGFALVNVLVLGIAFRAIFTLVAIRRSIDDWVFVLVVSVVTFLVGMVSDFGLDAARQ
jgi:purine-cytosine permease-like protein